MKSTFLRVTAIVALMVGFSALNTAYASHENEFKFTGVIESLPNTTNFVGDWRVNGRTVHVTSSTPIEQTDGRVAVGAIVKVEGTTRADNSVDATEIEVKQAAAGGGSGDDGSGSGNGSGGSGSGDDGSGSGNGSGGSGSGDDDSSQPRFKGTIETLPLTGGLIGDWGVGGRTIHVSSSTRIEREIGPVAVGAFVEIKGAVRADGSMDATKIEVKSNVAGGDGRDELNGTIQSLPNTPGFVGDWRVNGRTVHVSSATIINREHGALAVGALVEVKGTVRPDGSIDATRIEVKSASGGSGGSGNEGQSASLKGSIQSLPGSTTLIGEWLVNNRVVHVTTSTRLNAEHGAFGVGTRVKVKGLTLADGSIVATKVQTRD